MLGPQQAGPGMQQAGQRVTAQAAAAGGAGAEGGEFGRIGQAGAQQRQDGERDQRAGHRRLGMAQRRGQHQRDAVRLADGQNRAD